MCGIFGFSDLTPVTRAIAPFLAYEMEDRGTDSWGATDGYEVIRHLDAIGGQFYVPDHWTRGIFHTRAASVGEVTVENSHPFTMPNEDNTRHLLGIHNGCVSNYRELNTKYSRSFPVDSMHIFANLVEGRPTDEIGGWGACAYYDTDALDRLYLFRFNCTNLCVARLETGEFVFASTDDAVKKAVRFGGGKIAAVFHTEAETQYWISRNADGQNTMYKGGALPFGFRSSGAGRSWKPGASDYTSGYHGGSYGASGSWSGSTSVGNNGSGSGGKLIVYQSGVRDGDTTRFSPNRIDNVGGKAPNKCLRCHEFVDPDKQGLCTACLGDEILKMSYANSADYKILLPATGQGPAEWVDLDACEREVNWTEHLTLLMEGVA
jgi:hypothetical protein